MPHHDAPWSPSDELLDRFLTERVAPDERSAVEAWLARTPAAQQTMQALRQLRFSAPLTDGERQALWQRIDQRFAGATASVVSGRWRRDEAGQPPSWAVRYVAIGAVLGVALLLTGWGLKMRGASDRMQRPSLTYSTTPGERATITLPDGSMAMLNVASRLDVPADYGAGNHTVRLTGEALFTVTHRDRAPFVVLAGTTTTRVLGTSFLVRHYSADSVTTVAVRDGKVTVGPSVRPVVLTAHQRVDVWSRGDARISPADGTQFSFATGTLTLPEMPLAQAIPELNRWYDADIQLGDPVLGSRHIVGEFVAGSLVDLRAILEMTFGVRVVRAGRTLTLFLK